jgi:hypothetical protein
MEQLSFDSSLGVNNSNELEGEEEKEEEREELEADTKEDDDNLLSCEFWRFSPNEIKFCL